VGILSRNSIKLRSANSSAAFNSALVIYSALLIQHQTSYHNKAISFEETELTTESLQSAIECLSWLYKGNQMTETCVRYISALAHRLTLICVTPALICFWDITDSLLVQIDSNPQTHIVQMLQESLTRDLVRSSSTDNCPQENFNFFDSADLYLGMELDEFWQHPSADFVMGNVHSTSADNFSYEP
jgi:hypothetical protein